MKKPTILLMSLLMLSLAFSLVGCKAEKEIAVSIDSPISVNQGGEFAIKVNVQDVSVMASCRFAVLYDDTVIQVMEEESGQPGITDGIVGFSTISIQSAAFSSAGDQRRLRVYGKVQGVGGASGSGYLAEIHFRAVGSIGTKSSISITSGVLRDIWGQERATRQLADCSVTVVEIQDNTVSISVPNVVYVGSNFDASVTVQRVKDLADYRLDVTYDPAVIQIVGEEAGPQGITSGVIDPTDIHVEIWSFTPAGKQGTVRVLGKVSSVGGASGSGYLARIHFKVVGSTGMKSYIRISNVMLSDVSGHEITNVNWLGSQVSVSPQ
jgi:hypothetical protein